ncbi:MAG: penicillin-binding protein activator [Hyphomicrobiaceae bacterium]
MAVGPAWTRRALLGGASTLLLAGCSGQSSTLSSFTAGNQPLTTGTATPAATGETIKAAMLLPLSAGGNAARLATDLKQAGELALFEMNRPDIQLIAKDSLGTAEGARTAAAAAISEGAEIIIGPLFSAEVTGVSAVTAQSRVPVIAFSSDRAVAGNGVYLLSFLPGNDAARAVAFAAGQGHKFMAALIPSTAFGDVVETAVRDAATAAGVKIAVVERYGSEPGAMVGPLQRLKAEIVSSANGNKPIRAVLVPGGQDVMPAIAPMLGQLGIGAANGVQLIGTSGWDYATVTQETALEGSWFAAPDPRGWSSFSERYAQTYKVSPSRIASLGYDAVSLAIAASTGARGQRFSAELLTRPSGFAGIDGLFRLRPDGTSERALAMLGISQGRVAVVDPAPSGFAGVSA